jgi:ferredoxin
MLQPVRVILGLNNDDSGISLDKVLEPMDSKINKLPDYIHPAPESKPRTPFDSDVPKDEMALANMQLSQKLQVLPQMLPLLYHMWRGSKVYENPPQATRTEASPQQIQRLEKIAYDAGAEDIRYVQVPRNAIFKEKGIPHEYAIVFTVEMAKEPIDTSPSFESQLEVMKGYKRLAQISSKVANYLRDEGFSAYAGTALGGTTDYVHLGELAGLGAIGYHGLLITPGEGARVRIGTIYVNIENLPLNEDNEHLWVRDFCAMCKKCVRKCPVDAIYQQPEPRGDGGMQSIDHATCRDFFTRNNGCGICLAVCPFSQVGYDKVKSRFKGNPDAPQFQIPVSADVPLDSIPVTGRADTAD